MELNTVPDDSAFSGNFLARTYKQSWKPALALKFALSSAYSLHLHAKQNTPFRHIMHRDISLNYLGF